MASHSVSLRPTVIVGLGGQGTRIAVALKARLEERFADDNSYSYRNLIRFLCIDTSKESFEAVRPNHPELPPVVISQEEMIRIGDLNLTSIRNAPEKSGLTELLPERLFGSQIYLGAQQIRRLGRIALLNDYSKIEQKVRDAITTVMHQENRGKRVGGMVVSNEGRLRFFVICSVCGGTGSGTFIDVAYLIKDVANQLVTAKCDVVGVFLLPEALPEVTEGTGKTRLRANAYASLLDLEYFNQDVPEDVSLYTVPVGKPHEIPGQPFDNAYLVQPGGKATLRGMEQIAPIVADALDMMICTRLGEQIDATMDNIRHKFIDNHAGFRTFYSALGIAQIVYPERWVQRQAALRLKNTIINNHLIGAAWGGTPSSIEIWCDELQRDLRAVLEGDISRITPSRRGTKALESVKVPQSMDTITKRLTTVQRDLKSSSSPVDELRTAAHTVFETFDRGYRSVKEGNKEVAIRCVQTWLREEIITRLKRDSNWRDKQGLQAILEWLRLIRRQIDITMAESSGVGRTFDGDKTRAINEAINGVDRVEALPFLLMKARRDQAIKEADRLRRIISAEWSEGVTSNALYDIFDELRGLIDSLAGRIRETIRFWEDQLQPEDNPRDFKLSSAIDIVPSPEGDELLQAVEGLFKRRYDEVRNSLPSSLFPADEFPDRLGAALTNQYRDSLAKSLERWCDPDAEQVDDPAAQRISHYTEKISVMDYLRHQPDWGKTLTEKAAPLLNYSADVLQTRKPVEIQVLGVNRIADISDQMRDVDLSAFSKVETGDSSRITVINTVHAIPFNALAGFSEYRDNYRQLLTERNAIFHLNNELENDPFDPSFEQFVNVFEFEGVFARALAYHWLWYDHMRKAYYLTDIFYQDFSEVVEAQITEWKRLKAQARTRTDLPDYRRIEEEYETAIKTLETAFAAINVSHHEIVPRLGNTRLYTLILREGQQASSLSAAFLALYHNQSPMLPRLFQKTLMRLEAELSPENRREAVSASIKVWQGLIGGRQGTFSSRSSSAAIGVLITDEPLLRRLLLQLKGHYHLETKMQRMSKPRHIWWDSLEKPAFNDEQGDPLFDNYVPPAKRTSEEYR
jgi:hypothetical protein